MSGCNQKHHFLLHRANSSGAKQPVADKANSSATFESKPQQPSSSSFAGAFAIKPSSVYLNIIPVKVSAGNRSIDIFAFLDQGSTTTLCDRCLLDLLNIAATKASYSISTINERSSICQGVKVNLSLSSPSDKNTLYLQSVLTVGELPIKPNPPLSSEELSLWPHLRDLSMPEQQGDVMLLIGVDAPEAFWMLEERRGNTGEPFAVRTTLGWSLVGPRCDNSGERGMTVGHNAFVNFVSSGNSLNQQIELLWRLDSVSPGGKREVSMSREDRYALHLTKQSTSVVEDHYQLALPWKPVALRLDDNRQQAVNRLAHLKNRLMKNPAMKEKYVSAVETYIANGHAELTSPKDFSTRG